MARRYFRSIISAQRRTIRGHSDEFRQICGLDCPEAQLQQIFETIHVRAAARRIFFLTIAKEWA
jgi:hypothetical protein